MRPGLCVPGCVFPVVSWSAFDTAKEAVMRRILVVDDDLHTRLAIRTWLKRSGFRVAIADGGPNGLAAVVTALSEQQGVAAP